jgi:hypothetical protein
MRFFALSALLVSACTGGNTGTVDPSSNAAITSACEGSGPSTVPVFVNVTNGNDHDPATGFLAPPDDTSDPAVFAEYSINVSVAGKTSSYELGSYGDADFSAPNGAKIIFSLTIPPIGSPYDGQTVTTSAKMACVETGMHYVLDLITTGSSPALTVSNCSYASQPDDTCTQQAPVDFGN